MTDYRVKEIENTTDLDLLRKGRCPWCLKKLVPVFVNIEELGGLTICPSLGGRHMGDECPDCKDRFY